MESETKNLDCSRKLKESPPKKILIRAREHIGDLVNSSGAILTLRTAFPESHIVLEVGEGARLAIPILYGFDEVWIRPRREGLGGKLASLVRIFRGRFDAVFVLEESPTLIAEAFLAGVPLRIGVHKGYGTWLYSGLSEHRKDFHESRGNFRILLEAVGLGRFHQPCLVSIEGHRAGALAKLSVVGFDASLPTVAIHCAAPNVRRHWPVDHIRDLSSGLVEMGIQCVLLGSPEDRTHIEIHDEGVLNLIGELTLGESAAVISMCDACVVPDSCLMHVAATLGVPVVALYQNCNDPVYTGPVGENHLILKGDSLRHVLSGEVIDAVLRFLNPSILPILS